MNVPSHCCIRHTFACINLISTVILTKTVAAQDNTDIPQFETQELASDPPAEEQPRTESQEQSEEDIPQPETTEVASHPPAEQEPPTDSRETSSEPTFRRLSITVDPIRFVRLRTGATIEYLPTKHVGIRFKWRADFSPEMMQEGSETSFELGLSVHSGSRGAHGWFVAPSAIYRRDRYRHYNLYTLGADVGWNAMSPNGVIVGGAIGFSYDPRSKDPYDASGLEQQGIDTRVYLAVGYAF